MLNATKLTTKPTMKKNLLIVFCLILFTNKNYSQTNWELLNPKPTDRIGIDIDFVSTSTGYIITATELLETQDAGATWLKKQNITSGSDMSFYNTTGYIVGSGGYVLKSTDSGTTWNEISTGFTGTFNTVTIIDGNNVILSTSNSIVKTTDGGLTWVSLNIPNVFVKKTSFTSALVGHAVCNNGTILKTINGGQNWYATQTSNIYPSNYFTVYFVNENIGFATREHNYLFKTTDGGETWTELSGISQAIYDLYFLDINNGFATGAAGATFKTTDGGITWTPILFQPGYYGNTSMYGIYFQNSTTGFATGARGRIIKTIDGGTTWTHHSPTYNDISDLRFMTNNIGYGLVGNRFFKTTDGGNTWINIGAPVETLYTGNFNFINENLGYALVGGDVGTSGNIGTVYKTTDGGISWNPTNNGLEIITEDLYSIDFIDENVGFVSGGFNQRKVMKTTNGGASWTQVETISFGQIQFLNSQVGYGNRVGYSGGRLYKTVDGGSTWTINSDVDENISSFHFLDQQNGYFVCVNGLMYKTTDGGTTWQELSLPYEDYTLVKFFSNNIGYIADDFGNLLKTMNGGASWNYVTTQNGMNSIEIVNDKIFTAGTNGRIFRSEITYDDVIFVVNPAQNITNSGATISGNVTSNEGVISNIAFNVGGNNIPALPNSVNANESLNISADLTNLAPNTTYSFKLTGSYNSTNYSSQFLIFTTLPDYEITTNNVVNYTSSTAQISGTIVSNESDITAIEFQYGISAAALTSSVNASTQLVTGNTSEYILANLEGLMPGTQYFYRIKATHEGNDIYGSVVSFTTHPDYNITLYSPIIMGNTVTLEAYVSSYNQNITNIVFEYGTIDYENSIVTNPSQVNANNSSYISATLLNLDANAVYYYRLKAIHNGEIIYSQERVFNLSGTIIMVSGTITQPNANALELKGLINSYGAFLTNIQFEYGVTDSFGSSLLGTPNFVYGYNSNLIKATIPNPLSNQTYYYRLVATNNGNTIYSDTYEFTTGTLSLTDFDLAKEVSIYPNPATNYVNITSNMHEKIKSIEFYNALGQLTFYENFSTISDVKINISNFRKGLYLIKVTFESNKVVSTKLILN